MRKRGVVLLRCERSSEKAFSAEDIKALQGRAHTDRHTHGGMEAYRLTQPSLNIMQHRLPLHSEANLIKLVD